VSVTVAKRKSSNQPRSEPPKEELIQLAVKVVPDLAGRVDATATGLGLDRSNFLRMLIMKCLPQFEREAEELRRQRHGGTERPATES
jgi:hypothetical protein